MAKKATVMAVVNQKGGTGKTTTTENLGVGLAMEGKKVLVVDTDPQASLTISLGYPVPDELPTTLSNLMAKVMTEQPIEPGEGILHHPEGIDLMPSNIELSGLEVSLVNAMSRETILRQYLDTVKQNYDFILLDCMPSLGMLTVNALAAADSVLIPVQAQYLPAKGLEQLLQTINKVRRQINPKLKIEGILLTMVDNRTNYAKDISNLIRESYGGKLKVYKTDIPRSVRAEEISAEGTSIFKHDPKGKVADAYRVLTKEVLMLYNLKDIGMRIAELRKQEGLTQEQLAGRLNISTSNLGKLERGLQGLSIDLLLEIGIFFGVPTDYILLGHTIQPTTPEEDIDSMIRQLIQLKGVVHKPLRILFGVVSDGKNSWEIFLVIDTITALDTQEEHTRLRSWANIPEPTVRCAHYGKSAALCVAKAGIGLSSNGSLVLLSHHNKYLPIMLANQN